jgi:alkylation response protein AidB-like acyl-CoA dehydrogenase
MEGTDSGRDETMKIDLGPRAEAFREEIRTWLDENHPGQPPPMDEEEFYMGGGNAWLSAWMDKLREGHWLCVGWPTEYGGRGLTGVETAVLNEEFARAKLPRVTLGMGESLVGPSIIVWGTEEQKRHFLPRIVAGEDIYCQGFSEPGTGSDLAGLRTKGTVYGDEIVIEGQKVWTSGAQRANHIFTLCRTDSDVPKHQGISYVLVPMKDNNVEPRPLKQMSGASGFSEVFITGARAPLFNIIGGLNNGWKVAMTTLGHERGGGATTAHLQYTSELNDLLKLARESGASRDPIVRQQLAWAYSHVEIMRFAGLRALADVAAGKEPGPEASINKLFWSEYHKKLGEIATSIIGMAAAAHEGDKSIDRWQRSFLGSRAGTIYSGTSQIQKNIIGERALGLPKEPDAELDKTQAWGKRYMASAARGA